MNSLINFSKKIKKIIFFGYSPIIEELVNQNKKYKLETIIITSKDQLKNFKKKKYIKVFDQINRKLINYIKNINIKNDVFFISLGSRLIFDKNFINICSSRIVNFHCSRLPFDKGGGGYTWRILKNDRIDNQLVHLIDESIDSGSILMHQKNIFPKNLQTPLELEEYSNKNLVKFYQMFLKKLNNNESFKLTNNSNYIGSYYPRLNQNENGFLDWSLKDLELINMINSFEEPYCGVTTFLNRNNNKVHLKNVQLHGGELTNHPYMAGIVIRHDKNWIVVSTAGKNCLIIEKVIDKNKKNILSKIKEGDRFFTPNSLLEKNFNKRVFYNSKGLKK